jgi:hypothetical protein
MKKRFVESTGFTEWVGDQPASWDKTLKALQTELMENPETGDAIKGCGGLRKVRIPDPGRGKGKRGGARVIYLHVPEANWIFLLDVYDKGEKADITPAERKELAELAQVFRDEAIAATPPADDEEQP